MTQNQIIFMYKYNHLEEIMKDKIHSPGQWQQQQSKLLCDETHMWQQGLYKTMLQHFSAHKDLQEGRTVFLPGKTQHHKMSILPKLVSKLNAIPIKYQTKLILKFMWKN